MSPDSSASTDGSTVLNSSHRDDPRVAAFCSSLHPGLFHAVAYGTDIWRQDPFDVESIHGSVRKTFAHLVNRVCEPTALPIGQDHAASGRFRKRQDSSDASLPQPGPLISPRLLRLHADDVRSPASTDATF